MRKKFKYIRVNILYCTCLCYWIPYLTSGGGLEVVEVTVMCPSFWTGALCASLLHSQCPHTCCWCIHLQGYTTTGLYTLPLLWCFSVWVNKTHITQKMMISIIAGYLLIKPHETVFSCNILSYSELLRSILLFNLLLMLDLSLVEQRITIWINDMNKKLNFCHELNTSVNIKCCFMPNLDAYLQGSDGKISAQ